MSNSVLRRKLNCGVVDYDQIRYNFPNAEIITIADASHWVHVESPERFYQVTMGFASGNPSWYDEEKKEDLV